MMTQARPSTRVARPGRPAATGGFSLVEVLVATAVFLIGAAAFVPLIVSSVRGTRAARQLTVTTWMASQKLDELRGLVHARDVSGAPVTDTWTDTTQDPVVHGGGGGLGPSPPASLSQDTSGYVDYLGEDGYRAPPPGPYVRRWAVEPADGSGDLIRVVVSVHHVSAPGVMTTVATLRARRTP